MIIRAEAQQKELNTDDEQPIKKKRRKRVVRNTDNKTDLGEG